MTKKELIERINSIVEYISNGKVECDDRVFNGHPAFYLIHTKEEFDKELDSIIEDKDSYDKYDLYYYTNYMFKYMLDKYDSHTRMFFREYKFLPIKIRFIDSIPFIVDGTDISDEYIGAKILKINGIDINDIIMEMDKIICYASYDYLKVMLEEYLIDSNVIKSLPIMNIQDSITITTDKGDINFDLNNLSRYEDKYRKPNYNLEVVDNTAIITYRSCKHKSEMIKLIESLSSMDNIENYIIDLRGNGGGYSTINAPLVDFLKGKRIVALSDERVFSSARMCLIDLKNIGAKIIGTNPGTPISCFGNCRMDKVFDDLPLRVTGSVTYWYYDENLSCHGIFKEDFDEALRNNPNILDTVFLNVDERVELTLDDYINHTDSVIDYALSTFNNENKKIY